MPQTLVYEIGDFMFSQQTRIVLALGVVLGGSIVIVRSYLSTRAPAHIVGELIPATPEVQRELHPDRLELRPVLGEVPGVLSGMRATVIQKASEIERVSRNGPACVEDLGEAFVERLRFMIVPDAERDYKVVSERGDPRSFEVWSGRFEMFIESTRNQKIQRAIDPDGVMVSLVGLDMDGGIVTDHQRLEQGFGVLTGRGVKLTVVPSDPVAEGMLVAEVIVPMERRDALSGRLVPTIQGYRFAWHTHKAKWIPFESVVYAQPGHALTAPPL